MIAGGSSPGNRRQNCRVRTRLPRPIMPSRRARSAVPEVVGSHQSAADVAAMIPEQHQVLAAGAAALAAATSNKPSGNARAGVSSSTIGKSKKKVEAVQGRAPGERGVAAVASLSRRRITVPRRTRPSSSSFAPSTREGHKGEHVLGCRVHAGQAPLRQQRDVQAHGPGQGEGPEGSFGSTTRPSSTRSGSPTSRRPSRSARR
jgi:hypothetical protein